LLFCPASGFLLRCPASGILCNDQFYYLPRQGAEGRVSLSQFQRLAIGFQRTGQVALLLQTASSLHQGPEGPDSAFPCHPFLIGGSVPLDQFLQFPFPSLIGENRNAGQEIPVLA
jgi:hypothetical protein